MPASTTDGLFAFLGIAVGAALREVGRLFGNRKPRGDRHAREQDRLDAEKWNLLHEVRRELEDCRQRSEALEQMIRVEKWRTALLIRAMQEAQIPVPDAVLLDVEYHPETDSYTLVDRAP